MTTGNPLRRSLLLALVLAGPFFLASCEQLQKLMGGGEGGSGSQEVRIVNGFAIIDLDEIARRIGRSAALQNAINARENQLTQELVRLQNNFQAQVNQRQELIGTEPTIEQAQELQKFATTLNNQFNRARVTAQRTINDEQLQLIQKFRAEVLPIAAKIAGERGLTTIITKNEAVLFAWDPNFEITEEVIKRMTTPMIP